MHKFNIKRIVNRLSYIQRWVEAVLHSWYGLVILLDTIQPDLFDDNLLEFGIFCFACNLQSNLKFIGLLRDIYI